MRLVYVSTSAIPSTAANGVHVMRMCAAFAEHGHEVTLVVPGRTDRLSMETDVFEFYGVERIFDIEFGPWPSVPGRSLAFAWAAAKFAATTRADLVYGRMVHACYLAALRRLPVVFESHAPIGDYGLIGDVAFRGLLRSANFKRLVVISQALKGHYENRYASSKRRILVAPDAANPISAASVEASGNRSRMSIGYVGSLYSGRGVDVIMEMAKACPWADFRLVGGTDAEIKKWKTSHGKLANVEFRGFQQPNLVEQTLSDFDVLVAPYQESVLVHGNKWDTVRWMSPLKIFEYMAARKPIVASDLPVLRDVLHEGNSILVPPRDVEAWVDALQRLRSEELRRQLADQAHAEFMSAYTWHARAAKVLKCHAA